MYAPSSHPGISWIARSLVEARARNTFRELEVAVTTPNTEYPTNPANGRFVCSPEHPMPKGATIHYEIMHGKRKERGSK
jgi:hypothetical protein